MIRHALKQWIPPILVKALKQYRRPRELSYKIGDISIELPPGHTLPNYQARHKLFDRFLPILASCVSSEKTVVDVGANVGDTALMMLPETDADIICIEASDKFFPYLIKNIGQLGSAAKRLTCEKALVGTNQYTGSLEHYDGTAKFTLNKTTDGIQFITLDELVADRQVGLIKVDTDGFDFDVLLSATETLRRDTPVLFWENQVEHDHQLKGYDELYSKLEELDYQLIYIFDNFGNLVLESTTYQALRDFNDYLYSMERYGCTRTIYFLDVLAATIKEKETLEAAIDKYKRHWIQT